MAKGGKKGKLSKKVAKGGTRTCSGHQERASGCNSRVFRAVFGPCAWWRQRWKRDVVGVTQRVQLCTLEGLTGLEGARTAPIARLQERTHVCQQRCYLHEA